MSALKVVLSFLLFSISLRAVSDTKTQTKDQGSAIEAQASFQGDVVHVEFSGPKQWIYDLDKKSVKNQQIVEITLDPISQSSLKALEKFKSPLVKNVKIKKGSVDGKDRIQFEVSSDSVETFDYLTEGPSRLIVDFYEKDKSSADNEDNSSTLKKKAKIETKLEKKSKTANLRKPANTDILKLDPQGPLAAQTSDSTVRAGVFDGADPAFERFKIKDYEVKEDAIIRSKSNIYIPYPMLESQTPLWQQIKNTPAIYQIRPQDNNENKQARLLLNLFEKKRFLVFQKTLNWFREKYPNSEYNDMIDFMEADVEMALGHEAAALQAYRSAIQKHPKSPLSEKISLLIGIQAYERNDFLTALRLFQEHLENKEINFQGELSKDLARLGEMQVYDKLKKTEEALKMSAEIEKTASLPELKAEAAYRRGDLQYRNKKYSEAIQEYQSATKKYPESLKDFPGALYNQAEAMFWQNSYKEALAGHLEFIKKFPSNDFSALSMTRMGELLEVMGVDPTRVMGAYLEAYFRFGENPKAIIARIRLLSGRMKNMKSKEVEPATKEILELSKKLDWPQIESFATLMVSDGYTKRGEYSKSIELLTRYYQQNPTSTQLGLFQSRLVNNINDLIQKQLQDGQFISALKTHQKYADGWLKNSDRLDTEYALGKAFEMGGAYSEAEKFYRETLNKYYSVQGTSKGKELSVLQSLPSDQVMNLRLASVKYEQAQWSEAYDFLKNIKKPEVMSDSEQIERVVLTAKLLEKRGDLNSSSRFLSELLKTWQGQAELVAEPYLQLAEVELKQGQRGQAIQSLEKIKSLAADSGHVPESILTRAFHRLADIYIEDKNNDKAIEILQAYLEKFEEKKPLASQRYRLGLIYFQKGEIQKASEAWSHFQGDKSSFWQNLAQEKLKDSQWKSGYKKYIQRIPAMAGSGSEIGDKP